MATLTLGVQRREVWLRAARNGLWLGLTILGAGGLVFVALSPGLDAHAYWNIDAAAPYINGPVASPDAFLYSPVAAQFAVLLHAVPFAAFRLGMVALDLVVLYWFLGRWALAALVFLPVLQEMQLTNVNLLLAAVAVAGFRWPAAWSFGLLTKVTPGVGLLWFALRRDWRSLGIALGVTAILAATSWLLAPGWWPQWLRLLSDSASGPSGVWWAAPIPLVGRLAAAAILVAWGASTDRPWTVVVAATLAAPTLWLNSLSMLVGVVPLLRTSRSRRP